MIPDFAKIADEIANRAIDGVYWKEQEDCANAIRAALHETWNAALEDVAVELGRNREFGDELAAEWVRAKKLPTPVR